MLPKLPVARVAGEEFIKAKTATFTPGIQTHKCKL